MKVLLVQQISVEIREQMFLINAFARELEFNFMQKDYGEDIKTLLIGIICISPKFEPFFELKKPQYLKEKRTFNDKTIGNSYEIEKCFSYDLKIDFQTFKNSSELEKKKLLARDILGSLIIFNKTQTKINDFDVERFKNDLENYFRELELLE